jgi:hypothetical protein
VRRRSFLRCRRGRDRSSSFRGSRFLHRREGASTYLKPGAARGGIHAWERYLWYVCIGSYLE